MKSLQIVFTLSLLILFILRLLFLGVLDNKELFSLSDSSKLLFDLEGVLCFILII